MISSAVIEKFKRFDPALKVIEKQGPDPQKPGETCLMIRVERRKANGCYEHIGWIRPDLLGDGSAFLAKLARNDVRLYGSGEKAWKAYDAAEAEENRARKAGRQDKFMEIGKVAHDHYKRRSGQRINNAGMPT